MVTLDPVLHSVMWSEWSWRGHLAWTGTYGESVMETSQPLEQTSLLSDSGTSQHVRAPQEWRPGFPPTLQLVSVVLQLAKRACLPCIGTQDSYAQSVAQTTHPSGGCPPVLSPFSSESCPRDTGLKPIALLPFLPVYLSYSLGHTGVLLSVSSWFSVIIFPHVDVFLMCLWG